MDGSRVTVVVHGGKEVGKTTFIAHSLELYRAEVRSESTAAVHICGRDVSVTVIKNPDRLTSAQVAIVLIDLTDKDALRELPGSLERAQRLSPTAVCAVVATKADLYRLRKIATEDAVRFCESWPQGSIPLPYYETGLEPPDSIIFAFQEILARPLIDDYLGGKVTTEPELSVFINEAMDWCLENGSATLLSHLRSLGHSIPAPLFFKHPDVLSHYLYTQRPPTSVPEFRKNDLSIAPEPTNFEDTLDEPDEPLQVVDTRPAISVCPAHHLPWGHLSLTVFLTDFLRSPSLSGLTLTHLDLSRNNLSDIPLETLLLPSLKSLNVSHNRLSSLPPVDAWGHRSRLQLLNASHNSLTGGGSPLPQRRGGGGGGDSAVSVPCAVEVWNVDLSHNEFCGFPSWIMKFSSLKILNLTGNPQIHTLPAQLSRMTHLTSLSVDTSSLYDPPPVVAKRGAADLLRYLQLKRQASQVWSSLRVVVVGPQGSGKSQLLAKIKEDKSMSSSPTKGLEVTEWKHKGPDFFAFKSKQITVDFWEFSGDPAYQVIYSCFRCAASLHLLVCDSQSFQRSTLLRWLAGIQATSVERVPMILVFTHTDRFPSREQREGFRREVVGWLHSWQLLAARKGRSHSLAAIPQSIRNIFGEDLASSFEAQPQKPSLASAVDEEESAAEDLPLLPNVHRVFLVNAVTGDGVGALRKCLVKIASGSLSPELAGFSGFQMIGRDIPQMYIQVELMVRHLRGKFRSVRREGEQRPFYTLSELYHKKLRRPLGDGGITERDFAAALNFLHEYGLVYLHKCKEPATTLVSVDPQLVGYLLQRMIRAGLVTKEVNSTSCYLPNSHIFMLWGVEPVWSRELEHGPDTIHSEHLLDFLHHLNLCSPLLPGLTLLSSIPPDHLNHPNHPSPSPSLRCRRVYLLGFLPLHLFSQLVSRVVRGLLIITGGVPSPISPGHATSSANMSAPFEMESGHVLYVWKNNLFLKHEPDCQMLVKLLEGVAVCPSAVPHEARIDVLLDAPPIIEAQWLRIVTTEMDYLLEHAYPGLLDSEFSGQLVEVFVPFPFEGEGEPCSGAEGERVQKGEKEGREEREGEVDFVMSGEGKEGERGEDDVFAEVATPVHSKSSGGVNIPQREDVERDGVVTVGSLGRRVGSEGEGRGKRLGVLPTVGSLPSNPSPGSSRSRLLVEQATDTSSWEILSKQSSTSTHFSFKTDSTASHFLVPVWECLRAAFKSPVIQVNNRKVRLDDLVPDLLFGDVPPELLLRIHDDLSLSSPAHPGSLSSPAHPGSLSSPAHPGSLSSPAHPGSLSSPAHPGSLTSSAHNRMKTAVLQNGMGTDIQGQDGVRESDRHTMEQNSLPNQNELETRKEQMKRRLHTVDGVQAWNGIGTHNFGLIQPSASGLHIRSYYTSEDEEECVKRESGTARMMSLKRCLQKARNDLDKLRQLQCPYIVSAVGIHFSPPSVAVESSPLGSLHHYLREEDKGLVEIGTTTIHHILLQLLSAMEYFHREGLNYHTLQSENVLLWSRDPISIKLSDTGITHLPRGCELCSFIKSTPSKQRRKQLATRIDYMLLGLLIYEIATGTKPYEAVHPLSTVVLSLLHKRLHLSVEAELANSAGREKRRSQQRPISCHRLCMQISIEQCVRSERLSPSLLRARLSLCAGEQEWSPMRLTLNPECLLCSEEGELVYWTSASRGLVTGTLDIHTGALNSNILQEAPPPESGMFAKRHPKPVPIAVGRATALTLVEETQQLWVGAENGSRGSVYVFKLPDMRTHHYIHLQDAVLSLAALNSLSVRYGGESSKYRVLVGMANGTLIQFLGVHQEKVLENPLQGPKMVAYLVGNRPCIAMQLTAQGHVWCSSGCDVEVLDTISLRSIRRITLSSTAEKGVPHLPRPRSDVVTLLRVNWYGVWTVGRRSPVLKLWNQESGALISQYNINGVLSGNDDDITAMSLQGRAVWLGTRNGFLFLLDAAAVEEGRETCHLGLQHCGEGKVKNIVPLVSSRQLSAKLEVFCSLEFPDEVSGSLMMWSYQCQQDWRPKPSSTRSHSDPLPTSS